MAQLQTDTDTLDQKQLLGVLTALNEGDLTRRLPIGQEGASGAIAETFNTLLDRLEAFAAEMNRINWEVGTTGQFGGQAEVAGLSGTWKELIDNLNVMSANLTDQVRDISRVTAEVANGPSSRRVMVHAQGEMLLLKDLVNTLADRCQEPQRQPSPGR